LIVERVRTLPGLTGLLLAAASIVGAQTALPPMPSNADFPPKIPKTLDQVPGNPSPPPVFTIPAGPLGFAIPGEHYLLRRESLVSLDFLDEDRILFTFRTPGLLERDSGESSVEQKQQIQALVLSLPSGKVEFRATWTVPDRSRYLWMLNDGHFLVRVPDGLDEGDAKLQMKPYLRQPGRLLWIEMDPGKQVMIANSLEPATGSQAPGEPGSVVTEPPAAARDAQKPGAQGVLVSRAEKVASGEVMHVSRTPWTNQTADWPMNSQGYLENSHGKGNQWLLKMKYFAGGDRWLGPIRSTCPLSYSFVSDWELLFSLCDPVGGWELRARLTRDVVLWETRTGMNAMFPLLEISSNGLRVARETLLLKRTVDRYKRLVGVDDLQGQMVKVFNAANGRMVLESPLAPILDGGGNVALSPSGRRVAILNAGAIEVFQLPSPPPPPDGH